MTRRPPFPPAGLARPSDDPLYGPPVIALTATVASIGEAAARAVLGRPGRSWRLAAAALLALAGTGAALRLAARPAALPLLDAAGYGWWSGLAAGCLAIAGMLILAGVEWRCGIGRAVQTAGFLAAAIALLHPAPGGPLAPAALTVAAFALWAVGLAPDLAFLRDRPELRASPRWTALYRLASGGWRGAALHWLVWERACRGLALVGLLAAAACPIALAQALAQSLAERGERPDTLLPVALVVGAALSGAGLAAALAAVLRRLRGLDGLVTARHLDILGRLVLALGLAALYCHVTEMTVSFLYGTAPERAAVMRRLVGGEASAFRALTLLGLLPTQLLWIGAARRSARLLGLIGGLAALGGLAGHLLAVQAALPDGVRPDPLDLLAAVAGPLGLFGLALLLAARLVPAVSVAETRGLALARNRRAAAPVPEGSGRAAGGPPGLAAAFASEAGLVGALRALALPEGGHLDAFGPVPMPEAAAALRRDERALRRGALFGGALAAAAGLAVQGAGLAARAPGGWAGIEALAWVRLAVPALSAAALGAVLGIGAALALHARRARPAAGPPPDWREAFVLTVAPEAVQPDLAGIARQLAALPEGAGRPLALRRTDP